MLGLAAVPAGALTVAVLATTNWVESGRLTMLERAQLGSRMLLIEMAIALVVAPLAGVSLVERGRHGAAMAGGSQSARGIVAGTWSIAFPVMSRATLLAAASGVTLLAFDAPIERRMLVHSHVVFWVACLAFGGLGTLCASVFREPLDAAACAVILALTAGTGVFAVGPLLESASQGLLTAVVMPSPIVATAFAANIDLFRTEPFYQLSPLAHLQFDYPSPSVTLGAYSMAATLFFIGSAHLLGRSAPGPSAERISA